MKFLKHIRASLAGTQGRWQVFLQKNDVKALGHLWRIAARCKRLNQLPIAQAWNHQKGPVEAQAGKEEGVQMKFIIRIGLKTSERVNCTSAITVHR